jgi:hypothetical protein
VFASSLLRLSRRCRTMVDYNLTMSVRDIKLCSEGQFYDAVVEDCSQCADICRLTAVSLTPCRQLCRDYFQKHYLSTPPSFPVIVEQRLVDRPLFWSSVGSVVVAVAAFVTIVVLCVVRCRTASQIRRQRRRRRPQNVVGSTSKNVRETSSFNYDKDRGLLTRTTRRGWKDEETGDMRPFILPTNKFLSNPRKQGCYHVDGVTSANGPPLSYQLRHDHRSNHTGISDDNVTSGVGLSIVSWPTDGAVLTSTMPPHVASLYTSKQPVDDDDDCYIDTYVDDGLTNLKCVAVTSHHKHTCSGSPVLLSIDCQS